MPFKITTITAFISVDPNDGEEGVIGMSTPMGWLPFVCADEERVKQLHPHAEDIARQQGIKVIVARFSQREDLEEIK